MRLAIVSAVFLATGAAAKVCALEETCFENVECGKEKLLLEFHGSPPERISTNFGDFSVEAIVPNNTEIAKIRNQNGEPVVFSTMNDMVITKRTEDGSNASLNLVLGEDDAVTATLVTNVPRRYSEYGHGPRVFSGKCKRVL